MGETASRWLGAPTPSRRGWRWNAGAAAFALALAISAHEPARAASIAWRAAQESDALVVHASAELASDVPTAWRVLTDYERYGEFMRDVQRSVVHRDGGEVTVEQTLRVPFCLLRVPLEITWRITESPLHAVHSVATAQRMSIDGRYLLTRTAIGVRLDYSGRMVPAQVLPVSACTSGERIMASEFEALATEIERRFGETQVTPTPPRAAKAMHRNS